MITRGYKSNLIIGRGYGISVARAEIIDLISTLKESLSLESDIA